MIADVVDVAIFVGEAFDRAGIGYFVGGSLASSMQGEPRATNDIDFVIDITATQVPRALTELGADIELDREALTDAVQRRGMCNGYFLPLFTKLDLYVVGRSPFDRSEFERRRRVIVRDDGRTLVVKTPEDTILRKLWYRAGGGSSSKQWRDVVEVLRVSAEVLDATYVDEWASRLDLVDLVAKARKASTSAGDAD